MKIGIMITKQCNYTCKHCMVNSQKEVSVIQDSVMDRILDFLMKNRIYEVDLLGGEPSLYIELLEKYVPSIYKYCNNIEMYSNGSFLLCPDITNRIERLEIKCRISDDRYHRKFWGKDLEKKILESQYDVIKTHDDQQMFPIGRALYNNECDTDYLCNCALVNGNNLSLNYIRNKRNRIFIDIDGSTNLWCQAMMGKLGNILDEEISFKLLLEREKKLRNYLIRSGDIYEGVKMKDACNQCSQYSVNINGIFYKGDYICK